MIITKTPFRMSFFGGGTDMESFFRENGGAVLSTTFDKYCYVNVRHLPRFFDYSTELSYSKTERVTNIDDIQHPAIRNAMKMLDIVLYEVCVGAHWLCCGFSRSLPEVCGYTVRLHRRSFAGVGSGNECDF